MKNFTEIEWLDMESRNVLPCEICDKETPKDKVSYSGYCVECLIIHEQHIKEAEFQKGLSLETNDYVNFGTCFNCGKVWDLVDGFCQTCQDEMEANN